MKFAISNNERIEAEPGRTGDCMGCGRPLAAKCGEIKVWHWAHKGERKCDPWWENETEWHRSWKSHFPKEWQEIVHRADDGEKHIADVKTDHGYVIEFQHSPIKPEERHARERFYKKMIWIVDGNRRSRDKDKFTDSWEYANRIDGRDDLRELLGGGPLLRDWSGGSVVVLFDFGEDHLWGLLPKTSEGNEYGFIVKRIAVIEALQSNSNFHELLRSYIGTITAYEWRQKVMQEKAQRDPLLSLHFRKSR